jgi:hypothetical protein
MTNLSLWAYWRRLFSLVGAQASIKQLSPGKLLYDFVDCYSTTPFTTSSFRATSLIVPCAQGRQLLAGHDARFVQFRCTSLFFMTTLLLWQAFCCKAFDANRAAVDRNGTDFDLLR